LLDTKLLDRLADGKKEETYWPVAVATERFHCIILKGGEKHPYFPRPLLSDFEYKIPLSSAKPARDDDEDEMDTEPQTETHKLEHAYVLNSVLASLLEDLVETTSASHSQRIELSKRELEGDKALLQLLAAECREGEEKGMKALEIVGLMRNGNGKMMEAAQKVALRYGREILAEKIGDLAERRLAGLDDDDGMLE
jgi:chromosome transmission fidelity protein 4